MRTRSLFWSITASGVGLFLAVLIVPHVWIDGDTWHNFKTLAFAGVSLGLINFFVKPVIKLITFPLKFITFGLIGLLINIGIIWGIDILFPSFHVKGLLALFLVSIIVWACNLFVPKHKKEPKMPTA